MATPQPAQLGVTPPISLALPTEAENQATDALVAELRNQNNYESTAATEKRSVALTSLQNIVTAFVKKVSKAKGYSDAVANAAGSKIFTYGSFRLGVYGPGSDIDTLVVAPKHITRDDFFEYFPNLLVEMSPEGTVEDLTPVVDAFVPIIKFEFSGISIDLIFATLKLDQVSSNLTLQDPNLLRGLSETDLRSVNGTRVTDAILDLVPQKAVFRTALRGIKLWAQRRAIYANIMGFPGGVAWAMLVARVCQLYPKAAAAVIILKFFRVMERWQWPMPVLLKPIDSGPLKVKTWNPRIYKGDTFHLMPIITPAYPSMCSTHNITQSTKEIITRELKRGGDIADQIMVGKAPWKDLFVKHSFFTQGYKYYLSVISASTTKDAQNIWSGLCESKVRLLVVSLELHDSIAIAHPFNKGFERVHSCKTDEEVDKAKSGDLRFQIKEASTEASDADIKKNGTPNSKEKEPPTIVYTTTYYIGLEFREGAKSLDLSWQVDEFKHRCTSWEKYDNELNALNVVHTKNCDLPDDVFTEGEVKPSASSRKKKRTGTSDNSKLSLNGTDVKQEPSPAPKRQQTSIAAAG